MIFVHSYVLTPKADGADRAFDAPPNLIMQQLLQSVGRGAGTYERTDNPSIFDIATPIVSFVQSYVRTLKIDGAGRTFSSPYFILRTTIFSGRPRVGTYECTNNSPSSLNGLETRSFRIFVR
jgi:hypothetical protein